jgi:class 3 adenylate cyclase/tetratricopeptide (TPR) repeat protein
LIPSHQKIERHLEIGRLLLKENGNNIFDILNHYKYGLDLLSDAEERQKIGTLNLLAAKQAKASNAYQTAISYLQSASFLLGSEDFNMQYEYAACCFLGEQYDEAEKRLKQLLQRAKSAEENGAVYPLLISLYTTLGEYPKAIAAGIQGLRYFKVVVHDNPTHWDMTFKLLKLKFQLSLLYTEGLTLSPLLDEPKLLYISHIIDALFIANNAIRPLLNNYLGYTSAILGLRNACTLRALGLIAYSRYLLQANQFAKVLLYKDIALNDAARLKSAPLIAKLQFFDALTFSLPFVSAKEILPKMRSAYKAFVEVGEPIYMTFSYAQICIHTYFEKTLDEFERANENFLDVLKVTRPQGNFTYDLCNFWGLAASCLKGEEKVDSTELEALLVLSTQNPTFTNTSAYLHYSMLSDVYFLQDKFSEAYHHGIKAEAYRQVVAGQFIEAHTLFILALSGFAIYPILNHKEKIFLLQIEKKMKLLAAQAPKNYNLFWLLIAAEQQALQGELEEPCRLYNEAIRSAEEEGYALYAGIACESAFRFYLKSSSLSAKGFFQRALYHYGRFGAQAKVQYLQDKHPEFADVTSGEIDTSRSESSSDTSSMPISFDLLTVLKSAQALSSEIMLDRLLEKLIQIMIKHSGGTRAAILLEQNGKLFIEAEGGAEAQLIQPEPLTEQSHLPYSIINHVWRSRANLVIDNGPHGAGEFSAEPYLAQTKSVVCTPILFQGKLLGILYLENQTIAHAFTEKRLTIINLLSSQAAISLENARFYSACSRFVPVQFLDRLDKRNLIDLHLGDYVKCPMTIIFCDIRNFTSLSEALGAQEIFDLLNSFLRVMEPIISKYGGFIDKYIGDAIMALFHQEPESALEASIAMVKALKTFNQTQLKPIGIGIGINTGELILGIVGEEKRIESTVIGDSVNIASRVESLTKSYQVPLLISDHVKQKLKRPSDYCLRLIDEVFLKGKSVPIKIWEVCDIDPEAAKIKMETLDFFTQGRKYYQADELFRANELFELCLRRDPHDTVAALYLEKCKHSQQD